MIIKKLPNRTKNILHFNDDKECSKIEDRIFALWLTKDGKFIFNNLYIDINFELGKKMHFIIKQSKIGNKYWYEVIVNDELKFKRENTNPKSYSNVLLLKGPWSQSFTSEF